MTINYHATWNCDGCSKVAVTVNLDEQHNIPVGWIIVNIRAFNRDISEKSGWEILHFCATCRHEHSIPLSNL